MIIAAAVLLVLSLAMLVYVYLGYPLAVMLLSALRRRRVRSEDRPVSVTVLTAARNEAGCIAETVRNKLAADYPPELLEVIVVSDASDDGTDAILADLAIVEVALRNALHNALTNTYGPEWYQNIALDDRLLKQVGRAWSYLRNPRQGHPSTPGRVIAQCTFGMWVNLLDAGGYAGREPRRVHADYEQLWRSTLRSAFPGGRSEARNDPSPHASFTRTWVHSVAKTVNVLRNRVAHHEPLHNGFPLPGQRSGQQQSNRLTAAEGIEAYMKLTRMIDRNLAEWITNNTKVTALLATRPR